MSSSNYAKRMALLSARIFGEIRIKEKTSSKNLETIKRFALKPVSKMPEYSVNYYPRHQEIDHLEIMLRRYGLFRDEQKDFNEEMERLRRLRGKGRPERKKKQQQQPTETQTNKKK